MKDRFNEQELQVIRDAHEKLVDVPDDLWCQGRFSYEGKNCAVGHLMRIESSNPEDTSHDNCNDNAVSHPIRKLSRRFLFDEGIATVNNGHSVKYKQSHPKQRVLQLFEDMMGESDGQGIQ